MEHFRSYNGSVQLRVVFLRDLKHEAYVDLVHLSSCFLGTHHLTGEKNQTKNSTQEPPHRWDLPPGKISKSSKETKVLNEARIEIPLLILRLEK